MLTVPRIIMSIFLIIPLLAVAQTVQKGTVQEYNGKEKKTPLPGVELNVRSAQSTVSDKSGGFLLQFQTLKPGGAVTVRRIEKLGYEIFNKEALHQWKINPDHPFVIVMCSTDRFRQLRENYEKVASASYARQLKKDQATLDRLLKDGKLKEEEFRKERLKLIEDYERQLDDLEVYVDRFVRIDLSEISEAEQDIITLVQDGRMEEAVAAYDKLNIVDHLLEAVERHDQVVSSIAALEETARSIRETNDSLYAMADRQIQTLMLTGGSENIRKVASIYRNIADADPSNVEWLLKTGNFLHAYSGDHVNALGYYQKALQIAIDLFGPLHKKVAWCYNNLGTLHASLAEFPKAIEYLNKALELYVELNGDIDKDVASAYGNLGVAYEGLADYSKALDFHNKALEIYRSLYGQNHLSVALEYANIGTVLHSLGYLEISLTYLKDALAIRKEILSEDHPDVANALINIAMVLAAKADYESALRYDERALDIYKKIFGDRHPVYAIALNNIGSLYSSMGEYSKAFDFHTKSLDINEAIFGRNHPKVADAYVNLGMSGLQANGDKAAAIARFQDALGIYVDVYGPEHPRVAAAFNNIGAIYDNSANYSEALEYYMKALEMYEKVFGPDHFEVALTCNNIGKTYLEMGDPSSALEYLGRALGINENALGSEHPDVAMNLNNIASVFEAIGDLDSAIQYSTKALQIQMKVLGDEHPDVALSNANLGCYYMAAGDYPNALIHSLNALNIYEKRLGPDSRYVNNICKIIIPLYNQLGIELAENGHHDEALDYFTKGLALYSKTDSVDVVDKSNSYILIGSLYQLKGDDSKSLESYDMALAMYKDRGDRDNPEAATILYFMANIYRDCSQYDEAARCYRDALSILEKAYGSDHADTVALRNKLNEIKDYAK